MCLTVRLIETVEEGGIGGGMMRLVCGPRLHVARTRGGDERGCGWLLCKDKTTACRRASVPCNNSDKPCSMER